jgi:hypothetical protein
VSLLAAILPGVRQIRTPATVGALWIVTIALLLPSWDDLQADASVSHVTQLLDFVPTGFSVTALGFAAYLLGCLALSIQPPAGRLLGRLAHWFVRVSQRIPYRWLGGRPARYSRRLRQAMLEYPPSVMTPVGDSIAAAFARAGAPGGAHLHFPWDTVLERLDTAAVQLGQTAPVQAAEYDRLRAEAEFRSGVIAPLGVLSLVILWPTHWSLLLAVSAGLLVLAWQAKSLRRETHELLATCLYLGYAKLPTLESLADELKRMALPPKSSDGKWIGATVVALQRLGDWDLSDLTERKFLADSSNPDDTRDFVAYLKEYDAETAELAERLMERHSPRDSRAIMDELARASRTL